MTPIGRHGGEGYLLVDPDLKVKALRGGLARLGSQGLSFVLRLGFMIAMARLLDPMDFGLVAMVTVVTGIYGMFTNAGLSSATVQRTNISDDAISTLFWVNMLIGVILTLLCSATAPALVRFYHEPRLFWITQALAVGFLINAAGVQHSALLQRQLRYFTQATIDALSQISSMSVAIAMALNGMGYWSLIGAALVSATVSTGGLWLAVAWIPGRPQWNSRIRSMLHFGVTSTLNSITVYLAYNLEKLLLGRFWGAGTLGIYGRAVQLVRFPSDYLNAAIGTVAFSALSRLQDDPPRLRSYFLKSYALAVSMTLPLTIFCAVFADEIVWVLFGSQWMASAPILRLLAPTVLIFGMINPFAWLLYSMGLQRRSLMTAVAIAPITTIAYFIGLPYGPAGVAASFSGAMSLWLLPHIAWCLHGTAISVRDVFLSVAKPLFAGTVAVIFATGARHLMGAGANPLLAVLLGGSVMFVVYYGVLLFALGQRAFYLDLIKGLKGTTPRGPANRAAAAARQAPVFD
jgi:O-antigen/teichoic acid export membrane protein